MPKGYLRVLVFNQDSVLVDQRTVQLSQAALNNYEVLQTGFLPIGQDGYVSVYVGNESAVDVLFDDVQVEYRQGLLVQENQYDPYGLDLAGVSGAAPGLRLKNYHQFNGKENQLDLGLAWNHHDWRFFDYQLGRWHAVDPMIEEGMEHWTPYAFGLDNAVRYNDPDGQFPPLLIAGAVGAAVGAVIGAGIEAGTQMYKSGGHVTDWHAVGGAGLQGGVTGGVAGLTGGTSLLRSGAAGAISNVAGGIARNVYDHKPVTVGSVAKDAAVGLVTGVATQAAGRVVGKLLKPCGCFTAGTGISTRLGRKAIEQVQVGDSVWAYNERTHQTALRPVTHLFRYERDTVYVLHTATGEALRTTSDHPFYVRGQWVRVKRLRVGDSLVSQSGQRHVLRRIDRKPEHVTVYNFTVDELHTYFVGQNAILVHNCPDVPSGVPSGGGSSLKNFLTDMGKTTKEAGAFFGWGNKTTLTKSVSDFTKKELLDNGWNKQTLVRLARTYNDQIVKAQAAGAANPAAVVRRDQAMQLAREFFGK